MDNKVSPVIMRRVFGLLVLMPILQYLCSLRGLHTAPICFHGCNHEQRQVFLKQCLILLGHLHIKDVRYIRLESMTGP